MNLCKSEDDFWQRQTTPMRKHIKKISGNSLRRACGWKQVRGITEPKCPASMKEPLASKRSARLNTEMRVLGCPEPS